MWNCRARKDPYVLCLVSQQFSQGCPQNSTNAILAEYSYEELEQELFIWE